MKEEIKTKFFTFNQNNSGGYFVNNDEYGVAEYIIIESVSAKLAWKKLVDIGDNVPGMFDYCPCCGERWSDWIDDSDGKDEPMIFGEPINNCKKEIFRDKAFVHYLNGEIKEFIFID